MISSESAKNEWESILKKLPSMPLLVQFTHQVQSVLIYAVVVLLSQGGDLRDLQEFTFGTVNLFS